ncbi:MAG: hypothetical protein EPO61_04755 [Nitrospirae bacterium]|nr:MAG: hypothetical protein EPO61_04755 [Nitrospirota bacterium]
MSVAVRLLAALLFVALPACTSWQADYLTQQIHKASQEEVTARLGKPTEVKKLDRGGTEWVYHYFPDSPFNYAYKGHPAEPDCQEYILTFNERQVLTYWLKQECVE